MNFIRFSSFLDIILCIEHVVQLLIIIDIKCWEIKCEQKMNDLKETNTIT